MDQHDSINMCIHVFTFDGFGTFSSKAGLGNCYHRYVETTVLSFRFWIRFVSP